MKKVFLVNKILFFILILFIFNSNILAAFPSSLNSVNIVYANWTEERGQANSICIYSNGTITRESSGCEGTKWQSNYKKATGSDNTVYVAICTDHSVTSPVGKGATCTKDTSMTDANKAGIASILNSAGPFSLTTAGKCVASGEGSDGCRNKNYVKASITISKFLNKTLINDCTQQNICVSSWLTAANTAKTNVENAQSAKQNKTFVSIGEVTYTEDTTALYLTIPVSSNYEITSVSVPNGQKQTDGRYKILKSSLSSGQNTITITATAKYTFDIAENYICSGYQSMTINKTEKKEITDTVTKTINLNFTNTIAHWTWGFKNNEGNNNEKNAFKLGQKTFQKSINSEFALDSSYAITVPNGFEIRNFGTSSISGTWASYNLGTRVTQKSSNMYFEYNYYPINYNITYDLKGGINNSDNPSTYNVLYGVTLKDATRVGYRFDGWYKDVLTSFRTYEPKAGVTSENGVITFNNQTNGNEFNSSKIQVWGKNFEYYQQLKSTSTPGSVSVLYTHEKDTGDYNVKLAANGTTQDYSVWYKVHFEKGRKYYMSWSLDNYSSSLIKVSNFKIEGEVVGINKGLNATFTSAEDMYSKLQNRTTGDIKLTAKWISSIYDITYHGNGGYAAGNSRLVTDQAHYGEWYSIKEGSIFSRDNYTFVGWTTKSDGTDDGYGWTGRNGIWSFENGEMGIKNNKLDLYAMWQDSCVYEFKTTYNNNPTIAQRLTLYKNYHTGGWDSVSRRNLLNFTIRDAETACGNYTPNYNPQNACLSTNQINNTTQTKFTNQNISDYNDRIISSSTSNQSYCLTNFTLTKGSNVNYDSNTTVKAGRMIFNIVENDTVVIGTLTKNCYIHKDEYSSYSGDLTQENFIKTSDYLGNVLLDGVELNGLATKSQPISTLEGEFYKVEGTATIEYKANPVYVEKITGQQSNNCLDNGVLKDSCRILGYGVASKFVDGKKLTPTETIPLVRNFNFSISAPLTSIFNFGTGSTCEYRVDPEVIEYDNPEDKGKLEIEFRTIDTNNPFNRNTKSNWSGTTNSSTNNKVQQYITNSDVNNSYNRTGGGSLYQTGTTGKIILTPSLIQIIREYNDGTGEGDCANTNPSYNDYTVHKEENDDGTETTTTNFFKCIGLTKVQ